MALARNIIRDALTEIGVLAQGEAPEAAWSQLALTRLQHQIDAWNADSLTLAVLRRQTFTLTSGANTVTIGQSGSPTVSAPRPTWLQTVNYIVPGSSPEVEVTLAPYDRDSYASETIKELDNQLPTAYFYNATTLNGTLFFWPTVTQDVTIVLYYPQSATEPTSLMSDLIGPPGSQEAFMYQLAIRLCRPFGREIPSGLPEMAAEAYARVKRLNTQPGLLGVDAALVPSMGGAYNVLTDGYTGQNGA
jgi:hypothetical protein